MFLVLSALLNDTTALILLNVFLNGLFLVPSDNLIGVDNITKYFVKVIFISPLLGFAFGVQI